MNEPMKLGVRVVDGEGDTWERTTQVRPWVCISQGAVSGLTWWELEIGFEPLSLVVGG